MSALMCHDPETGAKETLQESVQAPEGIPNPGMRDDLRRYKIPEDAECRRQKQQVSRYVVQAEGCRAFEAPPWNRFADILEGILWDFQRDSRVLHGG